MQNKPPILPFALTLLFKFTYMIRQLIFYFLFVLLPVTAFAQSAEMLGMGNTAYARKDINAIFGNQAGLASLNSSSISINSERRFSVGELGSHTLGAAIPTKAGTFGLTMNYFGFSEYNEQKIGIAYARNLGEKFSLGAQFDYIGTRISEFGNTSTYTVEIGILATLTSQIELGAHFFNPISADRGIEEEPLKSVLSFGLSYKPSASLIMMADVEAELDFDPRYKLGIDYSFSEKFYLRVGAYTSPTTLSLGVGLKVGDNLQIDVATSYQTILGATPGIGIQYEFTSKK